MKRASSAINVEDNARTIDLVGFLCPVPVHETRRVLKGCKKGDRVRIICDDPETLHDIPALCDRLGVILAGVKENSGEYIFLIINETTDP